MFHPGWLVKWPIWHRQIVLWFPASGDDIITRRREDAAPETFMPLVFRIMRQDADGGPTVARSSSALGIRPGGDIDLDANGSVIANGKGMSVSPAWRDISILRIPKRLRTIVPGARGSNNTFCFRAGAGSFQHGPFAAGLELTPDSTKHGCISPAQSVLLVQYENDLVSTRSLWRIDES